MRFRDDLLVGALDFRASRSAVLDPDVAALPAVDSLDRVAVRVEDAGRVILAVILGSDAWHPVGTRSSGDGCITKKR